MKFKLIFIVFPIAMLLTACNDGYRDTPQQQVEDMKICKDGGMEAYQTLFGEIKCVPN